MSESQGVPPYKTVDTSTLQSSQAIPSPKPEKSRHPAVMSLPNPPVVTLKPSSAPQDGSGLYPVGRPAKFNWNLGKEICIRIQNGEVLSKICEEESMPSHATVNHWMKKLPKFSQYIERSRMISADKIAEKSMTMFDDEPPMEDLYTKNGVVKRISMSGVQLMRYKSQAMQWLASRFNPERYGDKMSVQSQFDLTVVLNSVNNGKKLKNAKTLEIPPTS